MERHSRMLTAGRGETAELTATVSKLAESLRAAVQAWPAPGSPRDSDSADTDSADTSEHDEPAASEHDEAEPAEVVLPSRLTETQWHRGDQLAAKLANWVREVYLRWPDAYLSPCWPLHPWVVEELWVLRGCWSTSRIGESASWLRWQDWHDRQRPATARRIADQLEHCGPDQHIPAAGGPYPVLPGAEVVPIAVTAWATEDHHSWPPRVPATLLVDQATRRHPTASPKTPSVPRRTLTPTETNHRTYRP